MALTIVFAACGSESATTTVAAATGPDGAAAVAEHPEAEVLRALAFAYWEAFNAYEPDTALSYLEAGYRVERDEQVRSDIGRLSTFRVKLGVSEESPPVMIGDAEAEMYISMKEPLGTRRIRMAFVKVGGEWKISFAQEVEG